MTLIQIWQANRKFALKIFISVWILWEIGVTITAFILPKSYRSIAEVKVEISDADTVREVLKNEVLTILSPPVLNRVIADLNLNEKWGKKYFGGEKFKTDESLEILANRITVTPARNLPVISILSYSDSPEEAADIANTLAEDYRRYRAEDRINPPDKSILPSVPVELVNRAQPDARPCKPNIPLCIGLGVISSTIYGAIAAVLAIGVRLFFKKSSGQKTPGSNNDNSPMPPLVSKY